MCYYTKLQHSETRDDFKTHISPYIIRKPFTIFYHDDDSDHNDDDDSDHNDDGDDVDMFTRELIR